MERRKKEKMDELKRFW